MGMIVVVVVRTNNNYDQLLVNKPLTNQQTRNCRICDFIGMHCMHLLCNPLFYAATWLKV